MKIGMSVRITCSLFILIVFQATCVYAEDMQEPYDVFMVQWRGDTATDAGFKSFFHNSQIPVTYTVRNPEQDRSAFPAIVEEIKNRKPDLVYTWSMATARGISGPWQGDRDGSHIYDIPVVNCMVSDPAVAGIAQGWGKSGRNLTGVSHVPSTQAQLNAMGRYRNVKKLSILYNTLQNSAAAAAQGMQKLAQGQGIQVQMLPLPLNEDGQSDISAIASKVGEAAGFEPDFLYLGPDSLLYVNRQALFRAVNAHRLATFSPADVFLEKGDALFGLVGSYFVAGQYCAYKAAQILKEGKEPGEIPFDTLRNFALKVNMSAAKRLKLFPPMDLLGMTQVIKTSDGVQDE